MTRRVKVGGLLFGRDQDGLGVEVVQVEQEVVRMDRLDTAPGAASGFDGTR